MVQPKIVARNTSGSEGGETPTPGRRQAHAPTNHGVLPCPRGPGGYAMFYVSTHFFDDRDKPPAVSRGGACLRPGGWGCGSALGAGDVAPPWGLGRWLRPGGWGCGSALGAGDVAPPWGLGCGLILKIKQEKWYQP